MAFRESIEAVLKVKDAARFKASMEGAARAVRKFGKDEEHAAATTKLLEAIERKLDRQNVELSASFELLAHSIDNVGDQMVRTTARAALMNTAMKKSGNNAFFLGKSFAFWKDRLSLTRSEILSTAYTLGAYFVPAIIAVGSSFANAALGGGAVAGAGLASFLFGLGALVTIATPVVGGIKKMMKAQDEYNLAVQQYGAASVQASRASAHLYAVMKTQGGAAVMGVVNSLRALRSEWSKATAPARRSVLGIIGAGLGTAHVLLPQVGQEVNQMMAALQTALARGLSTLVSGPSGGEFRNTLRVLGDTFKKAIGPGVRGVSNMILVLGRVIRAAAPWVVKLAKAWAAFTDRLVARTADQSAVTKFINNAVRSFKLWWGLLTAIGRTLGIIFGVSHGEGDKIVVIFTNLVKQFNNWLGQMRDTGQIARFWDIWNKSVSAAFWAFQHPAEAFNKWMPVVLAAIDQWLPKIMDHVSNSFAAAAPTMAWTFVKAWWNAGAWAKLFTVALLLRRFGVFSKVGGIIGDRIALAIATRLTAAFAAEGAIGVAVAAGAEAITAALAAIAPIAIPVILTVTAVGALAWLLGKVGHHNYNPHQSLKREAQHSLQEGGPRPLFTRKVPHHAGGGVIGMGGLGVVGEAGPEIAMAGPRGTAIIPLSGMSANVPDISRAMNFTIYTSVQIDKREVARAVSQQAAYDKARRS